MLSGSNYYLNMYLKTNSVAVNLMAYYIINVSFTRPENCGRRCEVMASAVDSRSRGPGSSPGWGYNIPFLDKANYFDCAYLQPGVEKGTKSLMLG